MKVKQDEKLSATNEGISEWQDNFAFSRARAVIFATIECEILVFHSVGDVLVLWSVLSLALLFLYACHKFCMKKH